MPETPSWGTPEPEAPAWGTPEQADDAGGPAPASDRHPRRRVLREAGGLTRHPSTRPRPLRRPTAGVLAALVTLSLLGVGVLVLGSDPGSVTSGRSVPPLPPAALDPVLPPVEHQPESIFVLTLGLCFDGPGLDAVTRVPCDQPHHAQYTGVSILDPGPYPGEPALARIIDDRCILQFLTFTGQVYARQGTLQLQHTTVSRQLWESGRREVRCAVSRVDGRPLTATTHP